MMYLWLTIGFLLLLLLLYPIRFHLYTEEGLKARVILYGFIHIPLNIRKAVLKFMARKDRAPEDEESDDFNATEIVENFKKLVSTRPFVNSLLAKMTVEEFIWYSAIPMENPLLGLSLLPIYTTAQTLAIDYVYTHFGHVKDYDIDTKYNYLNEDILIYFTSIIRINLLKILIVGVKYIRKWPLLIKRST